VRNIHETGGPSKVRRVKGRILGDKLVGRPRKEETASSPKTSSATLKSAEELKARGEREGVRARIVNGLPGKETIILPGDAKEKQRP